MPTIEITYTVFYDPYEDTIWTSIGSAEMGMARYNNGKKLYDLILLGEL